MRILSVTTSAVVSAIALVGLAVPVDAHPSSGVGPTPAASRAAECHRTLPAYPEIAPGTRGKAVRTLQCVLNDAGFGPVTVDGFYGTETKAAIKELTGNFECCVADRFRVRTWYWVILFTMSRNFAGLERGDSGIRVKTLQRALRADGETLVVDGSFGAQTEAQIKAFQATCDERETGRVDQQLLFDLFQGGCGGHD